MNSGFLRVLRRVIAYWRVIVLLISARAAAIVLHNQFVSFALLGPALLLIFIASQIFWIGRVVNIWERLLRRRVCRRRVVIGVVLAYLFLIAYSFPTTIAQGHTFRIGFYRLPNIVAEGVFWWWFVGSMVGFLLVMAFGLVDRVERAAGWMYRKVNQTSQERVSGNSETVLSSPSRRQFLQRTAVLVSATPFVAAGYGLLYERQDLEVVRQRVRLARLPKPFDGFRIAQLSDIHMGPFSSAGYVRRCVAITNGLKPDLIVLTGDYIAWDPGAEREVVRALAGLRAPQGIFGCLGNHEGESNTEDYVTGLFAEQGIHILRQQRAPIQLATETVNLMGIDDPRGETGAEWMRDIYRRLHKGLVMPGTVNVLLAHEPSVFVFDRAAELGIDLMLAGHTHGGQLALEAVHRGFNISHLLYRYTSGWYENRGAKLYVNRGIGTTGFPIRFGARPEITLFELAR